MKKITIKFGFLFFAIALVFLGTGIFKTVQSETEKSAIPKLKSSLRKQLDSLPKSEDIAGYVWYGIHSGIPEVKRFYDKYPYMADYRFNADDMNIRVKTNNQGITKVVTPKNDVLLEGKFDEVECTDCGIEVTINNKKGIFSYLGEEIIPTNYDEITCQLPKAQSMERYYITNNKDKWEVFDTRGKLLFKSSNYKIKSYKFGPYFEIIKNGKSGIIDNSGNIIIKPEYDMVLPEKIGNKGIQYFNVCQIDENSTSSGEKCGVVGLSGEMELPVMFKGEVEKIAADYYAVHIDDSNNNYVADKTGKITSKKPCGHIYYSYDNTYARCLTNGGQDVFRLDGKPIPADSVHYDKTWIWNDDLVEFEVNHKRGVLYKDKILIDPNYAWVKKMGEYFYIVPDSSINNGSRIIIPIKDLIESKDNIKNAKEYPDKEYTYEKIDDNCFKFIKNDDKTEDVYCNNSK